MLGEPQTNSRRKRRRGKVFTAADSTPIQARIPNARSYLPNGGRASPATRQFLD